MKKEYEVQVIEFNGTSLANALHDAAKWIEEDHGATVINISFFVDGMGYTVLVYWM